MKEDLKMNLHTLAEELCTLKTFHMFQMNPKKNTLQICILSSTTIWSLSLKMKPNIFCEG